MEVFENLKANLVGKNARIVLPEGEEPRILQAAKRIVKETDVTPVLLVIQIRFVFTLKLKEFWKDTKLSTRILTQALMRW